MRKGVLSLPAMTGVFRDKNVERLNGVEASPVAGVGDEVGASPARVLSGKRPFGDPEIHSSLLRH